MDLSVKKALDVLSAACETVESLTPGIKVSLTRCLAEDIFSFISLISNNNAEERYDSFDILYQNGKFPSSSINLIKYDGCLRLFGLLNEFSNTSSNVNPVRPDSLYISFFIELGNFYMQSKSDVEDIDDQNYLEYINTLQEYVKESSAYSIEKNNDIDVDFARDEADDLYESILDGDVSDRNISKVVHQLEQLHLLFPDDEKISEYYAGSLSFWSIGKNIQSLKKAKKELFPIYHAFSKNEEIAVSYAEILVALSEKEKKIDLCNSYLLEITQMGQLFKDNSEIAKYQKEIEQNVEDLRHYLELVQLSDKSKKEYENNPCLSIAIEYSEALCNLAEYEDNEKVLQKYSETINTLVKDYPDSIKLVERLTDITSYLAPYISFDELQKSASDIYKQLKKYPNNETIAKNYVWILECLCDEEEKIGKLVDKIKEYHLMHPHNTTITSSYARVLSIIVGEQSLRRKEKTLDLIWDLILQNPELDDLVSSYKDAFNRYKKSLPEERNRLFFNYHLWLEKSVIQVEKSTGEVVGEYETVLDACKVAKASPITMHKSVIDNTFSDNEYDWIIL